MASIVIEHLESDFFEWCRYEYERISMFLPSFVSALHITNFPFKFELENVTCHEESCTTLFNPDRICLLDSEASQTLSVEDANKFDYFLLGGILGNVDEFDFDRTSVLRDIGYERRNLGIMQMTTDTAAMVTSLIIHQGVPFSSLCFLDRPEFPIDSKEKDTSGQERLVMNFRYLSKDDGKPDIDPRILELAINDREFLIEDLE